MDETTWAEARAGMLLDPEVTNLNTGSFGPLSKVVFEEVTQLRHRLAEEPMCFLVREVPDLLAMARQRLAEYLGDDPRRLVFTANVTSAINIVAASLRLCSPGEILMTDHEYGAMQWCWERAAQQQGLSIRTFPLPINANAPDEIVDAAVQAMGSKTRLLFFSHVLSPTGMILPAKELCEEARRRGIMTVVDGAHAPGYLRYRLDEIPYDFYGGNCHKWMLAPTGSGFLSIGRGNEDRLSPLQVSWGWKRHIDAQHIGLDGEDIYGSTPRIRYLECEGVRDPCPWLAVPTAIDFQDGIGMDRIDARIEELVIQARQRLSKVPGLTIATPEHPNLHGAMTAFRVAGAIPAQALRDLLWDHRIEVPVIERPEGLLIRTSTHFYNTVDEISALAEMLTTTGAVSADA